MRKIILDMNIPQSVEEVHKYIAEQLDLDKEYGRNLDALYDELTVITQPTAFGVFMPTPELDEVDMDLMLYMEKIKTVFKDAEEANSAIAVIFDDLAENVDFDEEEFDRLTDLEIDGLYGK